MAFFTFTTRTGRTLLRASCRGEADARLRAKKLVDRHRLPIEIRRCSRYADDGEIVATLEPGPIASGRNRP